MKQGRMSKKMLNAINNKGNSLNNIVNAEDAMIRSLEEKDDVKLAAYNLICTPKASLCLFEVHQATSYF